MFIGLTMSATPFPYSMFAAPMLARLTRTGIDNEARLPSFDDSCEHARAVGEEQLVRSNG
jgi:hypothetical protein